MGQNLSGDVSLIAEQNGSFLADTTGDSPSSTSSSDDDERLGDFTRILTTDFKKSWPSKEARDAVHSQKSQPNGHDGDSGDMASMLRDWKGSEGDTGPMWVSAPLTVTRTG
jgi:hypothetical protein